MAQCTWVNRLLNNIFVNPPPLPLLCEISGALHLMQPGLTAGRLAGWLADWQIYGQMKYTEVNFEIFKVGCTGRNIRLVASFNQGTALLQPYNQFFG